MLFVILRKILARPNRAKKTLIISKNRTGSDRPKGNPERDCIRGYEGGRPEISSSADQGIFQQWASRRPVAGVNFDHSRELKTDYPATRPNCLASYVHVRTNESLTTDIEATSHLFYVLRSEGESEIDGQPVSLKD